MRLRPSVAERLWAFETVDMRCVVENLGSPELARAGSEPLIGSVELRESGAGPWRELARLPLERGVAIGAHTELSFGVEMKVPAGDYDLRLDLRTGSDGPAQLDVDSAIASVRVDYTIVDAFVELTNHCNFKCTFCKQPQLARTLQLMEFDLVEKVLHELADMGHHGLLKGHLMGEPLLHPRYFDFVRRAHDLDMGVQLVTNGSLFTAKNVAEVFDTGIELVLISLNTPDEPSYDAQRGVDRPFSSYVAGVQAMVRELARRGSPPVTRLNLLFDLDRVFDPEHLAWGHRITNEWIDVVREASGADIPHVDEFVLDPAQTLYVPLLDDFLLQWTPTHSGYREGAPAQHFCTAPWVQLGILVDGSVTACDNDADGEIVVGNVREQTIREIWEGPQLQRLRDGFLDHRSVHPRCQQCPANYDRDDYFRWLPAGHSTRSNA